MKGFNALLKQHYQHTLGDGCGRARRENVAA
jgi:hypothetical protein